MLALVAIVLLLGAGAYSVAGRYDWPWARPALGWADEARARIAAFVSLSRATFVYLFVLLITSWVLRSSSERTSQVLLATHSTNLHNLRVDPVGVLVTSAFYLTSASMARWIVPFVLVMAPVERWLGSLRTITVFAVGHVLATVVTAYLLANGPLTFSDSDAARFTIDVGVSYGFYCVAAMFTYRLRGRWWWSWIWATGLSLSVVLPYLDDRSFTAFGHVVAVATGFALAPMASSQAVRARLPGPIWTPPEAAVAASRAAIAARHAARHPSPP